MTGPCRCGALDCRFCHPNTAKYQRIEDEILAEGEIDPEDDDILLDAVMDRVAEYDAQAEQNARKLWWQS